MRDERESDTTETETEADNAKVNETKRRIIKVAFRLFKEKGPEDVTINDICGESGISKHTFYYYFKTKDEILASFMIIPWEVRVERLHSIITAKTFFERYWLLVEPIAAFFQEIGPGITKRFFFSKSSEGHTHMRKPKNRDKDELELSLIRKAREAGEIRNNSDSEDLLWLGFHLILSSTLTWCLAGGGNNLTDECRKALEVAFDVNPEVRTGICDGFRGGDR